MKYHEACQHLADLAKAESEGKKIQYCHLGEWAESGSLSVNAKHVIEYPERYRIAPTPTFRPWTAEEVPLGKEVRSKDGKVHGLIIGVENSAFVRVSGLLFDFEYMLEHFAGADGTPCGTEVTK